MLRARSEHPVRLETPLRNQIVDEHAEVRFIPPELQTIATPGGESGVYASHKTLGRGLFIARGPVDLAGEEEATNALGLEPPCKLSRLNEVVLDRVPGTQQHRVLEPGQCVYELLLDVAGHRHRKAIHVDFRCVHAFRLEENLVPLLVREPDDLVFERRAVARPDPLNLPIE